MSLPSKELSLLAAPYVFSSCASTASLCSSLISHRYGSFPSLLALCTSETSKTYFSLGRSLSLSKSAIPFAPRFTPVSYTHLAISGHPPFPVHSITGTLSESAFLFHACVLITLYSGMIQISGCAFPTGTALCFSRVFPTPPLSGISYARSVSGNNGFSMPDSSC